MIPRDVLVSLITLGLLWIALVPLARWVGLGRCRDCRRPCVPWDGYCWEHRP